jgi:hypothetical protein
MKMLGAPQTMKRAAEKKTDWRRSSQLPERRPWLPSAQAAKEVQRSYHILEICWAVGPPTTLQANWPEAQDWHRVAEEEDVQPQAYCHQSYCIHKPCSAGSTVGGS